MHLPHRILLIGIISLAVLAFACSSGESAPFPTAEPAATSTPVPAADDDHADDGHEGDQAHEAVADDSLSTVERGRALFLAVGCAACHGEEAEGTVIAPGLAGHNELQVRRQARGPIGVMPVFGRDMLTPENLDDLVVYVESLQVAEDGHMHGHEAGLSVADQSLGHHRMALTALEAGNTTEAIHHVEHLVGILEGQHLALMQEALDMLRSGDVHDAQHMIEGMLSDVLPDSGDSSLGTLHLQQALAGLRVEEAEAALHHARHALDEPDVGDRAGEIEEIIGLIESGDVVEAEEHLSALLGVESVGMEDHDADAMHMDGDEHAADEHDADAMHMDGDEHAADEHDADAAHTDGDEHDEGAEPAA